MATHRDEMRKPETRPEAGRANDDWLDISTAARYLSKSERFMRRLVAERRCRYYKHGRYVAFRRSDLDEWARSQCREPLP